MSFVLLVLLAGLIVCIALRKSQPDATRLGIPLLAGIAILVAAVNLLKPQGNLATHIAGDFAEAQGAVVGEAVVQALPDGGRLLVIQWDSEVEPYRGIIKSHQAGFARAIRKLGFDVAEVGPDPFATPASGANEDGVMSLSELGIPAAMVQGWLIEHGPVDAIVSFCTLRTDVYRSKIPSTTPIFVVAQEGPTRELVAAVHHDRVTAVVLLKPDSDWRVKPPKGSARDVFDVRYLLLTKDNVDEVKELVVTDDRR